MALNYYELEPRNNRFYSIIADITHKCNMSCSNCYIPNRAIPDMDKFKLFDLLKKLPFKCEIRLIGAEPTMRKDLPEIISKVKELNHRPVIVTNGLKLSNLEYVKTLKKAGLFVVNISLNGGNSNKIYQKTDGGAFANIKIKALQNLARTGFFINTNTILIRGINESVPLDIYNQLKSLKVKRAVMRFRNVGQLGRYAISKKGNYSFQELISLVARDFKLSENEIIKHNQIDGYREKNTILFPVRKGQTIYIKITDWSPEKSSFPDPNSQRRGRITSSFKIAPFFEHIKMNEFGY